MKLSKESIRQIRQFAKDRIGGFGMWVELRENVTYIGEVKTTNGKPDWSDVQSFYDVNRLFKWKEGSVDLHDFVDWATVKNLEIELVNDFAWLDFAVHDREELKDYVHVLVNNKGDVVKMWQTFAKEEELITLLKQGA